MDFQFWLYVIIGVIYFLSRVLKKQNPEDKKNTAQPSSQRYGEADRSVAEKSKPLTFEELLKEITEGKQAPKPVFTPQPRSEYVDYDDNIEEEEKDLETINQDQDYRKNEVYEQAKRQAFLRPSLEETMNVRDTVVEFGKFKEFEKVKQRDLLREYTKDFQDPEGLKKAFVLSEILNRKF